MATVTATTTHDDVPVLTATQQRALLRQPDRRTRLGKRDAALLALLLGSGCRIGEAVQVRVQDVQRGPNGSLQVWVRTLKRRNGKRPLRAVIIYPPFVAPVRDYLRQIRGWWLFEGRRGEHLSVRAAQDAVARHIKAVVPSGFHTHHLRHVAATDALQRSGGDVWRTALMLGHSDDRQVMQTYGHYLVKDAHVIGLARAQALSNRKD